MNAGDRNFNYNKNLNYNMNMSNPNNNNNNNNSSNNNSSINQPYTLGNSNNNKTPAQGVNNSNPYANYYNPLIIQNFYAMMQNQQRNNPNFMNNGMTGMNQLQMPLQNCFSSPYTMNKMNNTNNVNNNNVNNNVHNANNNVNAAYSHYTAPNINQPYQRNAQQNYNTNYTQQYTQQYNQHRNPNYNNRPFKPSLNFDSDYTPRTAKPSAPITKEESEEISKWVQARKKNFPSQNKIEEKEHTDQVRQDKGMMSQLEKKLREKIKVIKSLDKGGYFKKNNRGRNNNNDRRRRRNKKRHYKQVDEQPEEGEIVEEKIEVIIDNASLVKDDVEKEKRIEHKQYNQNGNNKKKDKVRFRAGFRYRKSLVYDNLIKQEKIKEMNILLQAFRFFVNEKLVD